MAKMEMAQHIAAHSLKVWQVASAIAPETAAAGVAWDPRLVQAAALLHDITKTRSLTTGEDHAASGRALLKGLGLEQVGAIVGQHVSLKTYPPLTLDEAVLVNYADKRVIHDRVVSLAQREEYILATYGTNSGHRCRIRQLWVETRKIEQRIFRGLPFGPGDMEEHLDIRGFESGMAQFRRLARLDL